MTPDTSRWQSSTEYIYLDELASPDLAWEWLRRNEDYQREFAENTIEPDAPEVVRKRPHRQWGLEFFRPAVADGYPCNDLLVA